ncbi:hypothetical protein DNAM5_91 [Haloarcula californiae tailed virus 1]|uniref:Uncharacterized protein n=1 Tax=Haloarcula californiae tailed virus 1 TaxID=1273746 RepID=R4TAJ3_9CAUD|nr:hypothetical protein M202_gp128 [Haloarcula californiae tailed virus 1]AGM11950.1 hypothetical protein DNAM5_91 [Haloarcula californiae tailed virus 1]
MMPQIELIRNPMNERSIGVRYESADRREVKGYGDDLAEAFDNLALVMRESDNFDETNLDSL